jgi:hypothetical protein
MKLAVECVPEKKVFPNSRLEKTVLGWDFMQVIDLSSTVELQKL